jgi:hypothetical protein
MNALPIKTAKSFTAEHLPIYINFDRNAFSWHQHEDEPPEAYRAFLLFCEIPSEEKRSYTAVVDKLGQPLTIIEQWGAQWRWEPRAAAYDCHLERAEVEALRREHVKSIRKQVALARAFQNKVITRLNALNPDELSPGDLAKWIVIAGKIERQALSEPLEDWSGRRGKSIRP